MKKENEDLFLSEEEIYYLSLYLAYGAGIGVMIGIIFGNIPFLITLGAVVGIVVSLFKSYVEKLYLKIKVQKSMLFARKM